MTRLARFAFHVPAALTFLVLALGWTWPLATHFSTDIPGTPGDNIAFLWNDWWMREAIASHTSFFHTDLLFAPIGIDLTLHTHTALSSWVAAAVFGGWPLIPAHNAVIVLTLVLNGLTAYLLAWDRVRHRPAALVAGVIFGASPYLASHLLGHVNLLSAWGLPLFALFCLRAIERRSWRASMAAGLVVVATAYNDYYYVVYCASLTIVLGVAQSATLEWRRTNPSSRLKNALVALLAVDVLVIAAVFWSGGFTTEVLGVRIAATRPTNPLAVGWLLLATLLLIHARPRLQRVPADEGGRRPVSLVALLPMTAVVAVGLAPILRGAWALYRAGDFTGPPASWRSGPAGVDLATLVVGHPWHGWLGAPVRSLYERWQINPVESVGWIGLVPVVLAIAAFRSDSSPKELRVWRWVTLVFLVWALGPWLRVAGFDTGLLLPQNVLAHLPIVSNARMPGRAMVVVFMAMAMLAAVAIARLRSARQRWLVPPLVALILIDYWPSPFPLTHIDTPALYATLKALPEGAVCELPFGIRDGFGMSGAFDDRVLEHQMVHGHPIVGGFAARVPDSIKQAYARMPVIRSLWRLSGGGAIDEADAGLSNAGAAEALRRENVAYLVVDRTRAPRPLIDYVEQSIAQRLIVEDGTLAVYEVQPVK